MNWFWLEKFTWIVLTWHYKSNIYEKNIHSSLHVIFFLLPCGYFLFWYRIKFQIWYGHICNCLSFSVQLMVLLVQPKNIGDRLYTVRSCVCCSPLLLYLCLLIKLIKLTGHTYFCSTESLISVTRIWNCSSVGWLQNS